MICSQYKLTYFGVVLLDFDELVDRQPELPVTGDAQVVSFAGAVTGAEAAITGCLATAGVPHPKSRPASNRGLERMGSR